MWQQQSIEDIPYSLQYFYYGCFIMLKWRTENFTFRHLFTRSITKKKTHLVYSSLQLLTQDVSERKFSKSPYFICIALNHNQRHLKALCTISARKNELGHESKQGATVARLILAENIEQIPTVDDIICPVGVS